MNNKGTVTILTDNLTLRKFTIEDAELAYKNWMNDEKVTKYLTWQPHDNLEESKRVISVWIKEYSSLNFYQWVIVKNDDNQPIGSISVVRIDETNGEYEAGYCLGYNWWNNGYMTESLQAVIDFLFTEVGVERVFLKHDANNVASGKVMQKCRLKFVDFLRKAGKNISNDACDLVCYAITKTEYEHNKTIVDFNKIIKTPIKNENYNGLYALVGKANEKGEFANVTDSSSTVIYGAVGVGSTSFLNGIILSLANRYSRNELKFAFITNNRVDFGDYSSLKRLYKGKIFVGIDEYKTALKSLVKEANLRKTAIEKAMATNVNEYNLKTKELGVSPLSKIVVFISGCDNIIDKTIAFRLGKLNAIGKTVGIYLVINCVYTIENLPKKLVKTAVNKFVMGAQNSTLKNKFIKVKVACNGLKSGEVIYSSGEKKPIKVKIVNLTDDDVYKWVHKIRFSR